MLQSLPKAISHCSGTCLKAQDGWLILPNKKGSIITCGPTGILFGTMIGLSVEVCNKI